MTKKKVSKNNPAKIKTIILSIVIAMVLCAFVIYFIQAIKPAPKYEDYCDIQIEEPAETVDKTFCESQGGKWTPQNVECIKVQAPCPQGYCDFYYTCQKEFEGADQKYRLVVFIVAVITGLIAVAIGIILSLPSVSSGLMLGGVFLTFYGTVVYWTYLSKWFKVIILGITLVILIWLGYKKLKN